MGFTPILAPLFTVEPRRAPSPQDPVQAILVTSGNAIAALAPSHTPVLAVGDTTAQRARQAGFSDVHSAGADAVALAALAARKLDPGRGPLLLATGLGQGMALAADLRHRGFRVIRRVCYAVRPVGRLPEAAAAAIAARRLHAALFLSAETASIFVRLLPAERREDLASVLALAIGQSTAEALESLPWLRICRAPAPTLDDVLALL
jgi:uroporphyrinogen-III synthase